ncbi:glycosyltransferase family 2 protein [Peribacillus deserti]|uniref:Glycosyl transferase family 2 n=1 Tax=Peribacillus deserti TaxID=673318 RepID=A0A2N5M0B7_9BACI|nr:glycosyltransferase [Peribacillus deserti]PLT27800.1 glycosyl transferase family 2 [Peribacillus deserti]
MLVSVIMAVYNGETNVKKALDSVLAQTYMTLEIIVINDGSTDSTLSILEQINDSRVRVINLDENQGAANALNIGISETQGDWIAIQDADDISYPARIEEQVNYIHLYPDIVGIGSLVKCIFGNTNKENRRASRRRNTAVSREEIRKNMYWICPFTHSSVMFSKTAFLEVGGYDTSLNIAYDYDLWLKLIEKGDMAKVPKILLDYSIHPGSLSHKDKFATLQEMQLSSSRAIFRKLYSEKHSEPRVIVMGPQGACEKYKEIIAPLSGLSVTEAVYKNWENEVPYAAQNVLELKNDAIIILDHRNKKRLLKYLQRTGLTLNEQVFNIYNIRKKNNKFTAY